MEGLKGLNKPVALEGQVEVILPEGRALGDPERLFQGYLLFLWKVLSLFLAWGPSLCLDMAHLCFLGEKSATVLHFHGVCSESKRHSSQLLGSCYTLSSWAGSAGNAGAACWQLAWSPAC